MAELRFKDITAEATVFVDDDFMPIDGETNNVRKISLDNLETQIRNGCSDAQMAVLAGIAATLTSAELNILDGVTATAAEINYLDCVIGVPVASKACVLDGSGDIIFPNDVNISGALSVTGAATLAATTLTTLVVSTSIDIDGKDLILDGTGNSKFLADDDNILQLWLGSAEEYRWDATAFGCATAGANSLGGTLGLSSSTAANSWLNLNLHGHVSMKAITAPGDPAVDEACRFYMDLSTGNLMVKLKHSGSTVEKTLASFA